MKTIVFKTSKPFIEVVAKVNGIKNPITLGIKAYDKKKKAELQKEFEGVSVNVPLEKATAELDVFLKDATLDKTTDEYYALRKAKQDLVSKLSDAYIDGLDTFYKSQILFIKNASLAIEDDGEESILTVLDTRTAAPIESLWENPEECLVVLLDYYFEEETYKDSLPSLILSTIFNYKLKEEGKIKN